jgi:hypothetical protein
VAWIATAAATAVGSGDWLGCVVMLNHKSLHTGQTHGQQNNSDDKKCRTQSLEKSNLASPLVCVWLVRLQILLWTDEYKCTHSGEKQSDQNSN